MTTYEGLYHATMSNLRRYNESAAYSPTLFMYDLSYALNDFQARTKVVDSEKKLFAKNNFDLGADVLGIKEITDEDDNKLLLLGYEQVRRIFETYVEGRTDDEPDEARRRVRKASIGTTPAHYDLYRMPPDTGIKPWDDSTRLCAVNNNCVILFPSLGDNWLQLYYYPNLEFFSERSVQWRAFFGLESNFATAFARYGVGDQMRPFEGALVDWVTQNYLIGEGSNKWEVYKARYEQAIQRAQSRPRHEHNLVSDYNLSPFSS